MSKPHRESDSRTPAPPAGTKSRSGPVRKTATPTKPLSVSDAALDDRTRGIRLR